MLFFIFVVPWFVSDDHLHPIPRVSQHSMKSGTVLWTILFTINILYDQLSGYKSWGNYSTIAKSHESENGVSAINTNENI